MKIWRFAFFLYFNRVSNGKVLKIIIVKRNILVLSRVTENNSFIGWENIFNSVSIVR